MKFIVLRNRSLTGNFSRFSNSSIDFPHNVFFTYIQDISYVLDTKRIMKGLSRRVEAS